MAEGLSSIDELQRKIKGTLLASSEIIIKQEDLLSLSVHESIQKKVTLISTASVELARDCTMFNEMARKLSVRNAQIQLEHKNKLLNPENIMVTTVNGIQVTWDEAVSRLVEVESSDGDRMGPMTFRELQQVASVIQGIIVVSLESVAEKHSSAPKAVSAQLLY